MLTISSVSTSTSGVVESSEETWTICQKTYWSSSIASIQYRFYATNPFHGMTGPGMKMKIGLSQIGLSQRNGNLHYLIQITFVLQTFTLPNTFFSVKVELIKLCFRKLLIAVSTWRFSDSGSLTERSMLIWRGHRRHTKKSNGDINRKVPYADLALSNYDRPLYIFFAIRSTRVLPGPLECPWCYQWRAL